jgi:small subunit ribosomal protein S1
MVETHTPAGAPVNTHTRDTAHELKEGQKEEILGLRRDTPMGRVFAESKSPPTVDHLVEGTVLIIDRGRVFVDIPPFGTGIIYGREFLAARDVIRKMNVGDSITTKVVADNEESGYIELSLKEARQAMVWKEAEDAIREKKTFEIAAKEANKGGLILEWQGIEGFLPASQLKPEHYPRVPDGDKEKILDELKKLIGVKLAVSIISTNPKDSKLIFSERGTTENDTVVTERYHLGDVVEGEVTGVVDFGLFMRLDPELEGLIHISEIDWGLVEHPRLFHKVGDVVRAKIIEIKDGKVSLSLKALKKNPWTDAATKYHKDDVVSAVIIKFNKHGALASIEEGVAGLVHLSDFGGSEEKLRAHLELGKSYQFKITLFDPAEQRMTLSYAGERR